MDALIELSRNQIAPEALDHPLIAKSLAAVLIERGDLDEAEVWLERGSASSPSIVSS